MRTKVVIRTMLTLNLLSLITTAAFITYSHAEPVDRKPLLTKPDLFDIELFWSYDLAPELWSTVWDLAISDGSGGFPAGLYISSGPPNAAPSGYILHIGLDRSAGLFATGFRKPEGLAFSTGGPFGTALYVAETKTGLGNVSKVNHEGHVFDFASDPTLLNPAGLAFGPGGSFGYDMYVGDFHGSQIVTIDSSGSVSSFVDFGSIDNVGVAMAFDQTGAFGYNLFTTFLGDFSTGAGSIVEITPDGSWSTFVSGLTCPEFARFGPGGSLFGSDLYVCEIGRLDTIGDGAVSIVDSEGVSRPFLTRMDATSLIFDTNRVFGGGIFIADISGDATPLPYGIIWRVTRKPGVGGIWVPVDKFGLLAPYVGLASAIVVAIAATAIHVRRVKRRKDRR